MKENFSKPPLNIEQQIEKLKKDYNIIIDDIKLASQYLHHNSYYRLRGYWYFYEKIESKRKIYFQDIINLYEFDRNLRNTFVPFLEQIEISIKTNFTNYLATEYKDPFVYLKSELFKNDKYHQVFLQKLEETLEKHSKEQFIEHFYQKYNDKYPPIWMITELLSFGEISKLYSNLNQKDVKNIADMYNLHPKCLINYIYHLTNVRNIIFHHMRFWNRTFSGISPRCISFNSDYKNKLFLFHTTQIINFFIKTIKHQECNFKQIILDLIKKYNLSEEYIYKYMKFPIN